MWTVTAEARVNEIYEELKAKFDEKHVEKETFTWIESRRAGEVMPRSKERHVVNKEMADKSLRFRLALKSLQPQLALLSGRVKVTIRGDDKSVSTKIEEV